MKWTKARPTESGSYLFRDAKRGFPEQLVEVQAVPKMGLLAQKEFQVDGESLTQTPPSVEWLGPIPASEN